MSFFRLWAIIRKEFRHIYRDRRLFFLVTISPTIMLVAFAYLLSFDVTNTRIAILDRDRSTQSRSLILALQADPNFIVVGEAESHQQIRERMKNTEISLGLVIPPDFGKTLEIDQTARVQVLGDGADPINTSTRMALLSSRIQTWATPFQKEKPRAPVTVRTLVWYNPDLKSSDSIVPALLSIVLILTAMAMALAFTREKELGSFESLASTPLRASEYVLGKLIPYLFYGLIGAALAIAVSIFWFRVPLRGDLLTLAVLTLIYLSATLGISSFIASFISTQSTALRAVLLIFLVPSFFLTGVIIPLDPTARFASYSLPATHFNVISRGIFLKALDWRALGFHTYFIFMMALISISLTILTFRKRVN